MTVNKNDVHAREHWKDVYDAIPKSVFATVAWHLANLASGEADAPAAAERMFLEEVQALGQADILPSQHVRAVIRAFSK